MLAKFKYPKGDITIQIAQGQTAGQACFSFANKANINVDDYDFKYGEKMLKFEEPLIDQLELKEEDQNEIEIKVIKKDPEIDQIVNVNVEGVQEKVVLKKGMSLGSALGELANRLKKPFKRLIFLYNGKIIDEKDGRKTFGQVANRLDKQSKEMNIVAYGNDLDEELNDNEIEKNEEDKNKIDEINVDSNDDEKETAFLLMNSRKFFIKLYAFLLGQLIVIFLLTFLGFQYDIDDYFSNSSKAFYWTLSVISLFALITSTIPLCLSEKPKAGFCAYFLWLVYIPIITIYCFLLKRHEGTDIIKGFYIIYQLIIFILDFLFVVIVNAIFKRYRGWIHLLILSGINALAIYIMAGPLSVNYDNLEMSHVGFVNISVISSVMIALIIMFNTPIVSLNKGDDENANALIGAIAFNSVPFVIALILLIIALVVGLLLGLLALILGIFAAAIAIYALILFLGGLF